MDSTTLLIVIVVLARAGPSREGENEMKRLLVRTRDQVVTKQELIDVVWPDSAAEQVIRANGGTRAAAFLRAVILRHDRTREIIAPPLIREPMPLFVALSLQTAATPAGQQRAGAKIPAP